MINRQKHSTKTRFKILQAARVLFALAISALFSTLAQPGTSIWLISLFAASGVIIGGWTLRRGAKELIITILGLILLALAVKLGIDLIEWLMLSKHSEGISAQLDPSLLRDHFSLLSIVFLIFFVSTAAYWCFASVSLIEIIILIGSSFYLLKGHRNYALDSPKIIADAAWQLQIDPAILILAIGAVAAITVLLYLFASERRPLFYQSQATTHRGDRRRFASITVSIFWIAALCFLGVGIYHNYQSELSRSSNGVGQNNKEGQSPLGFHSAVGKTKQPAALVRLQSDFLDNPWDPMLYLREGALSEFNGHEIVNAGASYDTDVPKTSPRNGFQLSVALPKSNRSSMDYSVYFLKDHPAIVAIDYPATSSPIEVPKDDRFLLAYKATSLVPAIKLNQLSTFTVGSSDWNDLSWQHYLRAPGSKSNNSVQDITSLKELVTDEESEDLRYKALSQKITEGITSPIEKALAISQYLSKESIYTRSPGHNLNETADPVAPYLFADEKRGYCVHFAHAAVYLMRLAKIPARIGTGYLTDLRYAKDGHILLHLGDRHAWPEVYVESLGWTIVDIMPERAENEEEIIPDEQLLEDLISKIDPIEDYLPTNTEEASKSKETIVKILKMLTTANFWLCLLAILFSLLCASKAWLRHGYHLTRRNHHNISLRYRAAMVLLSDIGLSRNVGETRHEFATRIAREKQINLAPLTLLFIKETYSLRPGVSVDDAKQALENFTSSVDNKVGKSLRILSFLNPFSIFVRRW